MNKVLLAAIPLVILASFPAAQEVQLPVFFLRYTGAFSEEEDQELEELLPRSTRHSISLRVKEEWSDTVTSNLTFYYSFKNYFEGENFDDLDDYWYAYVKPEVAVDVTDRLRLDGGVRSKWVVFDDEDASRDYVSLTTSFGSTMKTGLRTKLTTTVRGTWDLHQDSDDSTQELSGGVRVESRQEAWTWGGRYRAGVSGPLGDSLDRFSHLFGLNLAWDPNRR